MCQFAVMRRAITVFLDDFEGKTVMVFHADGSQDRSDGASGSTLLADNLAYVLARNSQAQRSAVGPVCGFHSDFCGSIHERLGDVDNQRPNFITFLIPLHKTPPINLSALESEGNTGREGGHRCAGARRNSSFRKAAGSSLLLSTTIGRMPIYTRGKVAGEGRAT